MHRFRNIGIKRKPFFFNPCAGAKITPVQSSGGIPEVVVCIAASAKFSVAVTESVGVLLVCAALSYMVLNAFHKLIWAWPIMLFQECHIFVIASFWLISCCVHVFLPKFSLVHFSQGNVWTWGQDSDGALGHSAWSTSPQVCMHGHVHAYIHKYMNTCVLAHTRQQANLHTHTHTHKHTHTKLCSVPRKLRRSLTCLHRSVTVKN